MFKKYAFFFLMFGFCVPLCFASELDRIIAPEIKDDAFYQAIYHLAKNEDVATILEIGSSSGEGSTEAFVLGMRKNPNKPTLFCLELSLPRFEALCDHYRSFPWVKCYNMSSIPLADFPTEAEIASFMETTPTNLNMYGVERVIGWLRQDIAYVKSAQAPQNGIETIKRENNIDHFDVVLIDGSEFTGKAEFKVIYGARFILLDDINAFKNYANYMSLCNDTNYELIEENKKLRNGYAIFRKK